MKGKGKILSTLLIGTVAAALSTSVHAYSANLTMSGASELKAGDTITLTVGVSGIDADPGIDGFEANLKYDHDVFEKVEQSDLSVSSGCAGWSLSYNSSEDQQKITLLDINSGSRITDSSSLFTISLKAKDSVGSKTTSVTLNGSFSGGEEDGHSVDISPQTKSVAVSVVGNSADNSGESSSDPEPAANEEQENNNSSDEVPATLIVNKGDSTKAVNKIPQTGENDVAIYTIAGISIISVISLAGYMKYRKYVK